MTTKAAYRGKVIPYTNSSGSKIPADTAVTIDTTAIGQVTAGATLVGIALNDIANLATGSIAVEDVWEVTKNATTDTFAQGAQFGMTSNKAVAASASNLVVNGYVYKASTATDTTVFVKLK